MINQPIKCIPSATPTSFLLHLCIFMWQLFGVDFNHKYINLPSFENYGGRLPYLTMLTAYALLIGSGFAAIVDFIQLATGSLESTETKKNEVSNNRSLLFSIRDELISFWCFTTGLFVPLMYWSIVYVDKDGIHSPEEELILPLLGWHNQFLHTLPVLLVIVLVLFVNYEFASVKRAFFSAVLLGTSYTALMYHCQTVNGFWPYHFLDKLSFNQIIVFITCSNVVFFIVSLFGRKIASVKWNENYAKEIATSYQKKR